MTGKERIIAALEFREPDRVPRGENSFDNVFFKLICGYDTLCNGRWQEKESLWSGNREAVISDYIDGICTIAEKLCWDYVRVPVAPKIKDYSGFSRIGENEYKDDIGRIYAFNPRVGNVILPAKYEVDLEIDDLKNCNDEIIIDDSEMDILKGVVERLGKTHFIIGRLPFGGTFNWDRIGMEEYLERMITEPEFIHAICQINNAQAITYAEAMINAGCDAVMECDDYADNKGLMMGKARYNEFIEPYLRKLCKAIHDSGGYFIKHTDGVMWDALDSFADMGIDGWHGIQPSLGMDIKLLKEKYAGKFCLFGGMNVETLIAGSEEDIRGEVRHAITHGAPGGGFVLTGGNVLEPGTNHKIYLSAMNEADTIGKYPITSIY